MKRSIRFFGEYIILILSAGLASYAYFCALFYYWSCFEWSPFGYETCGLEVLVWAFSISPLLIFSLILKILLVKYFQYPKSFLVSFVALSAILYIFMFSKGLGQGIMSVLFIIREISVSVYSAIIVSLRRKP